jgi:chromosome segregation protein
VAEIEDTLRRAMSKREVLEARRADVDETPGSRFLQTNPGRAIGLLRDLVESSDEFAPALSAALGPYADAVVYERAETALEDVGGADGATLAAGDASGAAPALGDSHRALMLEVGCDPRARGLLEAILSETYLVADLATAASKQRQYPGARFVTRDGVLVGRGVIRTAAGADTRARAINEELANVEREIARANQELKPARQLLDAATGEAAGLSESIGELEARVVAATLRIGGVDSQLASGQKEVEMLTQRLVGMDDAAESWRAALASAPALTIELPPLPLRPEAPVSARVAVETIRRDRLSHEARLERLRSEYDALGAETPQSLRAAADAAEEEREAAEIAQQAAADGHGNASARREAAVQAERDATNAETAANREWREAAAELERLRETYEEEDRARGEIERRISEGERTLKEGYGRDAQEALAALADTDTVADLERRSEVVARRLALLGRVNLLATGEFEVVQQRHDFLMRELDDVKKARRDLLEVVRRVDDEVIALFDAAFRDVAREFEAMFKELFPGGEGRLVLTDPANLLETGIDVEARPGRKRVKRLSLLSGGERALTALGFLFSIFKARPSPFYLLDEVEAALDDVNLHRFLGLIKGFAQDSQVIIVTHQKRTMEVADMLYGVSMSPDVSSKVVCQKLDHGEALEVKPLAVSSVSKSDSVV